MCETVEHSTTWYTHTHPGLFQQSYTDDQSGKWQRGKYWIVIEIHGIISLDVQTRPVMTIVYKFKSDKCYEQTVFVWRYSNNNAKGVAISKCSLNSIQAKNNFIDNINQL